MPDDITEREKSIRKGFSEAREILLKKLQNNLRSLERQLREQDMDDISLEIKIKDAKKEIEDLGKKLRKSSIYIKQYIDTWHKNQDQIGVQLKLIQERKPLEKKESDK